MGQNFKTGFSYNDIKIVPLRVKTTVPDAEQVTRAESTHIAFGARPGDEDREAPVRGHCWK
jgi:hypothetical protein